MINPLFAPVIEKLTQRYTFDGLYIADYLKMLISYSCHDDYKNFIVTRLLKHYTEYRKGEVLQDLVISNSGKESFLSEIEASFKIKDAKEQEAVITRLDQDVGSFIDAVLGRGITYLTHDVDIQIDNKFNISVKVSPSLAGPDEKYARILDNIAESGGWVSERERERAKNGWENTYW